MKFDIELRYAVPIRYLRRNVAAFAGSSRILDAGCGPYGLAFHLGRPCIGIDTTVARSPVPSGQDTLVRIQGSVTALPFRDRSFEFVTSMDTLEHLPASKRAAAVRELFRVASRAIVVGVPFGPRSEAYDRTAQAQERARGGEPEWRREHVSYGLPGPELDDLIRSLCGLRQGASLRIRKHENIRFLRLRLKLAQSIPPTHAAHGIVMAPLYAIARRLHIGTCYRKLYYVELE